MKGALQRNYKWIMVGLLAVAYFFNQADRVLFGLLTIPIQDELHLSDLEIGAINTALFATLALFTPFTGPLGDRFSRKWIITFSVILWSLMTVITGFAGGFWSLMFFRSIAAGVGEACYGPSAVPLIAAHHVRTRSLALAIHQSAIYIGLMFSGAIVAVALHLLGSWREVFVLFGGAGLLLGIAFVFVLKDVSGAETEVASVRLSPVACIKAFFANRSALLLSAGFIAIVAVNNAYVSWAPKFASACFSLSVGDAGNGTMFYHNVAATIAIFVGGAASDRIAVRRPRGRLVIQILALLFGAPALMMFGYAPSVGMMWTAVAAYGLFRGLFESNTYSSVFEVVPPEYRSTTSALMGTLAFSIGSLSPLFIGWLAETSKTSEDPMGIYGFRLGFILLGAFYVLGASVMLIACLRTFNRDREKCMNCAERRRVLYCLP